MLCTEINMLKWIAGVVLTFFLSFILYCLKELDEYEYRVELHDYGERSKSFRQVKSDVLSRNVSMVDPTDPIILWWTPFTKDPGTIKTFQASDQDYKCFFADSRAYQNHSMTKAFMFYGTDFKFGELPLPRRPQHDWALLHEESPKNTYLFSHEEALSLFNHTSTFKRESDCPLTTLYLADINSLESEQYTVSVEEKNRLMREEGLSLVNYVYSDCECPSDRDRFVEMLQRYITVDSYGRCLHNKDLPKHLRDPLAGMLHTDFLRLTSKYKFTLAMENAVCDDYITEKVWRPLEAGSVPIIFGSPKIKDYLPDNQSAIIIDDFSNVSDLAALLLRLNASDNEYEQYRKFKTSLGVTNTRLRDAMTQRTWAINNQRDKPNFIDNFERHVCLRVHERLKREKFGQEPVRYSANVDHYGCPIPKRFAESTSGTLTRVIDNFWAHEWTRSRYEAVALRRLVDNRESFTGRDVERLATELQRTDLS